MISPIVVHTQTSEIAFAAPFAAFVKLREALGADSVYLLESLSGPARDRRSSLIGLGPLLRVAVDGTLVTVDGQATLVRHASERLREGALTEPVENGFRMRSEADLWNVLRALERIFQVPSSAPDRFTFGFFGYLGYDVMRAIERFPESPLPSDGSPTLILTVFQGLLSFEFEGGGRTTVTVNNAAGVWEPLSIANVSALVQSASSESATSGSWPSVPAPSTARDTISRNAYLEKVARALEYIRIGDIYQVQLGHEIVVGSDAHPLAVYERLRSRNPSPYMYFAPLGDVTLVGASPESFIRIENRVISMRPIAGTVRRGETPEEDARLISGLRQDEKERAEHIMLVDLCRNDIGRVCAQSTLNVDELMVVERYSHVSHLVSHVSGRMRADVDAYDALAATFPAGTMSGAPKVRAMEIIAELETTRRGIYAGAVGLIDFGGYVNMALCIRSATLRNNTYRLRASAGVVSDSRPESEWRETLTKMAIVYWAVTGEELPNEGLAD